MPLQQVIVGRLKSNETQNYKKVGTVKTRRVTYGPTKSVTNKTKKLVAHKNQLIRYQETKTIQTVDAQTCPFSKTPIVEEFPVHMVCDPSPLPDCETTNCPTSTCKSC